MNVFALADLHLSATSNKPMDVFGPHWANHQDKIERAWRERVAPEDAVLLCGDLSWALKLPDAVPDLEWVDSLPGTKFFIRGNHDFWFSTARKIEQVLGPSMRLVRCNAHVFGGVGICGARGWLWPGQDDYEPQRDQKHWQRAIIRLGLSLEALAAFDWDVAVAMIHYPPIAASAGSALCDMIRDAGVRYCVYGHLHSEAAQQAFEGEHDGVLYRCVSADRVDFAPALILPHP